MRYLFFVIATLLLIVGCESTETVNVVGPDDEVVDGAVIVDEVEEEGPCVIVPPPVLPPVNADWELIATLQRNPLSPAKFYIFPEENEAISEAYEEGKHFIFELGGEFRAGWTDVFRHYIIQPEKPFQDKDKSPGQVRKENSSGIKDHVHKYLFLSDRWYRTKENFIGEKGIGLGVEFYLNHAEPRGHFIGEGTLYGSSIGVIDSSHLMGRRNSVIEDWTRLRIYVSR